MLQGVGFHGIVARGVTQHVEEPLRVLPLLIDGELLQGEKLLPVNELPFPSHPKVVLPIEEDVGCKDMNGVGPISDQNIKIRNFPFILFKVFSNVRDIVISKPLVTIFFLVEVGCF